MLKASFQEFVGLGSAEAGFGIPHCELNPNLVSPRDISKSALGPEWRASGEQCGLLNVSLA